MAEAGPAAVGHHVEDLHSAAEAEAAVRALLDLAEPPTALFTAQNLVTSEPCAPCTARGGSTRSLWWASTTCSWPTCCSRASR